MSYDFRMDEFLDFFLMLGRLTEESVDRCFHEGVFNPRTLVVEVIPNKKERGYTTYRKLNAVLGKNIKNSGSMIDLDG